jgi:hypothetical protein
VTLAEAAADAADAGMRAIVAKSHHNPTASDAAGVRATSTGRRIEVFGGIVLNTHVGGFNADAVNVALALGARIVWLPTLSSPVHIAGASHVSFPTATVKMRPDSPVDVFTPAGKLRRAVKEVLRQVAEADAILASGHLSPASIIATFREARELGVRRLLVNHPNFIDNASRSDVRKMVELGALVEHAACHYDPRSKFVSFTPVTLARWIRAIGPERSVIASDLGQAGNPLPADSLAEVARLLRRTGTTMRELRMMMADNPRRLLGV